MIAPLLKALQSTTPQTEALTLTTMQDHLLHPLGLQATLTLKISKKDEARKLKNCILELWQPVMQEINTSLKIVY